MPWGVFAIGKPGAVAEKLKKDFSAMKYPDVGLVEGELKDAAQKLIMQALAAQDGHVVKVAAGGRGDSRLHQTLQILVEPVEGFVEG